MANLSTTIDLIFKGDNQASGAINSITSDISSFGNSIGKATAPAADLTKKILVLEGALIGLALAFGKSAFDASIEFGRAQTELVKVLDDSDKPVGEFTDQIIALSNTYAVSASETLEALATWRQSGFTAAEAGKLTESGLKLVIAGSIDAAASAELLIKSIKGFGLAVDEVDPFISQLNRLTQLSGVSLEQLGDGMSRIADVSGNLGFSYQEIAGLLAPVIEKTQDAERSSTGLRNALLRLADPTAEISRVLESLGVDTEDASGNLLSVKDIVEQLAPAFNQLTDEQKANTAAILGGKQQAGIFTTVMEGMANSMRLTQEIIKDTGQSLSQEIEARMKSAAIQVDRLETSWKNLQIVIGLKFRESLASVYGAMSNINVVMQELVDNGGLYQFFQVLNPALGEVKRIAGEIAEALPDAFANADFSGFSDGLFNLFGDLEDIKISSTDLRNVITTVFELFESGTEVIEGVGLVFGVLGGAIGYIAELWDLLPEPVSDFLLNMFGIVGAVGIVVPTLTLLASAIGFLFAPIGAVASVVVGLGAAFTASGATVTAFLTAIGAAGLLGYISDVLPSLGSFWDELTGTNNDITGAEKELNDLAEAVIRVGKESSFSELEISKAFGSIQNQGIKLRSLGSDADEFVLTVLEVQRALDQVAAGGNPFDFISLDNGKIAVDIEALNKYTAATGNLASSAITNFATVGEAANDSSAKVADSTKKAIEATEEYQLKLLEIASDERIQIIKAKFEVDIARLEGDTKQVVAAFESIDNTVNSTGDLIGSLFGELSNLGRFEQLSVFDQIEKENRRRQEALDLQKKLVDAQIAKLNAQTRSLQRGNALINVDASPLAPHLQSILHEVLKQIQLTASADMMEFLLNVDPDAQAA